MGNFGLCDYSKYVQPYELGLRMLEDMPRGSWVFPGTDNSAFILMYLKFCKGQRPDTHILTPTGNFLDAVSNIGKTGKLTGETFRREYLRDPSVYRDSLLNQAEDRNVSGPVFFSNLPDDHPGIGPFLFPLGTLFVVGDGSGYDPAQQRRSWMSLLADPVFVLAPDSKKDFREHMAGLLYVHGLCHFRRGEFAMAEYLLTASRRYSVADQVETVSLLGRCKMELGDYAEAVRVSRQALSLDERDAMAWSTMGWVFGRQGRHDMALKCFESILTFNPSDISAQENVKTARARAAGRDPR
jgi:tetratricopeptide (TPR) repeat protein